MNNKLTMYARKDATDQRRLNGVGVMNVRRETDDALGLMTVYAEAATRGPHPRVTGIVNIKGLSGEALANAVMKAETKAKRRATLSLVGLGFLDESEVESAGEVEVDPTTGEILERPKPPTLLEAVQRQRAALAGDGAETAQDDVDPAERTDAPDVGAGGQNAVARRRFRTRRRGSGGGGSRAHAGAVRRHLRRARRHACGGDGEGQDDAGRTGSRTTARSRRRNEPPWLRPSGLTRDEAGLAAAGARGPASA